MTDTAHDERIAALLRKVARLRALAAAATTQAEAEAAASQAAAIIAKYQLSEAEAALVMPDNDHITDDGILWSGARRVTWVERLARTLSDQYGCCIFWQKRPGYRQIRVVGRRGDVAILRYMLAWLMMEILRLSCFERGGAHRSQFRHGAVTGYQEALSAAKERAAAEHAAAHGTSAALVLASRSEDARAFAVSVFGTIKAGKVLRVLQEEAYHRGVVAGARLQAPADALGEGQQGPRQLPRGK